jgi:hypothetical protein
MLLAPAMSAQQPVPEIPFESYAHAVRVDKDDNIWSSPRGSNMVITFNPRAAF